MLWNPSQCTAQPHKSSVVLRWRNWWNKVTLFIVVSQAQYILNWKKCNYFQCRWTTGSREIAPDLRLSLKHMHLGSTLQTWDWGWSLPHRLNTGYPILWQLKSSHVLFTETHTKGQAWKFSNELIKRMKSLRAWWEDGGKSMTSWNRLLKRY